MCLAALYLLRVENMSLRAELFQLNETRCARCPLVMASRSQWFAGRFGLEAVKYSPRCDSECQIAPVVRESEDK